MSHHYHKDARTSSHWIRGPYLVSILEVGRHHLPLANKFNREHGKRSKLGEND
jgi:hypothetical protein